MTLFLILFLEGILTFISPCILPLMPVYVSYFVGSSQSQNTRTVLSRVVTFTLGFSVVFVLMGLFSGSLSRYLIAYRREIQIVTGTLIMIAGLKITELVPILNKLNMAQLGLKKTVSIKETSGLGTFFFFGTLFALGWTPCLSAYLGTALMLAAQSQSALLGGGLLLVYSIGMSIPFILTTFLLTRFTSGMTWIKQHYRQINIVSGVLMIAVGLSIVTGWVDYLQLLVTR